MGIYTLSSDDRARLGLSITVSGPNSPGARSAVDPEQVTMAIHGTHPFALVETMNYPGAFHVSFNAVERGESLGKIYFKESPAPARAQE